MSRKHDKVVTDDATCEVCNDEGGWFEPYPGDQDRWVECGCVCHAIRAAAATERPATPELDKQTKAILAGSNEIGAFLDWLQNERGVVLAYYPERDPDTFADQLRPVRMDGGIQGWLAEYFGIDLDKIEAERRALLERIRKPSEAGA